MSRSPIRYRPLSFFIFSDELGHSFSSGAHYRNFSIMVPLLPLSAHSPEKPMTDGNFGQISEACRTSGGVEKWNSKVPS